MKNRIRNIKPKEGELVMYWGKETRWSTPEIMYAWRGDSSMKWDSKLLYSVMGSKHPDLNIRPLFSKMCPSLIEELESRGFDMTTLRFSISKKQKEETV